MRVFRLAVIPIVAPVAPVALVAAIALASAAAAQESAIPTGGQAIGGLFEALGVRKSPPPPPDFVRESRPARMDYAPLAPKAENDRKKRAADMRAASADLDRAIAENKRKAARVKTPD